MAVVVRSLADMPAGDCYATTMFVRFRETRRRLQVSLVETHRSDGKVQHEHIGGLGSVPTPPDVVDRIAFWASLHQRLAKLGNRVDAAAAAKVLAAVHARIAMVTAEEQRGLQLENAKADAEFWNDFADLHAGTVDGHKGLVAAAEKTIARSASAEHATQAKDRIARIERGEDVQGGLHKPLTYERAQQIMRDAGLSRSDIEHCQLLYEVGEILGPAKVIDGAIEAGMKAKGRAEKAFVRNVARGMVAMAVKAQGSQPDDA
jgi:hypothetical protein